MTSGKHICFVLTTPFALNAFVAPIIRVLISSGWRVTVAVNCGSHAVAEEVARCVEVLDVKIVRHIAPVQDISALWALNKIFRDRRFDIVHSITPKAGLLAMLASKLACTPIRVHTFTGQVWVTQRGLMRWLLHSLDWVLAQCATALLVDSPSQFEFLVGEKIVNSERLTVLGSGSIAGIDLTKFTPNPLSRETIRRQQGISSNALVLLYVGRMHPEKGVVELVQAFQLLSKSHPETHLILVGPDEGAVEQALSINETSQSRIHVIGHTAQPENYMAAADIYCLASYREGFGLSLIEAAASGLPCVASHIYGVTDAVVDGVTGLLVGPRDVRALAAALLKLADQPVLRQQMGANGRKRVEKDFSQNAVVAAWMAFYQLQLQALQSRNTDTE